MPDLDDEELKATRKLNGLDKDIDNKKAEDIYLKMTLIFYEDKSTSPNIWGSESIVYHLNYSYKTGIIQVIEVGGFGDQTLVKSFRDRRNRGITEDEMLENIKEISQMTYKEFKEKILEK